MQDAVDMATEEIAIYKGIVVQPKDVLSIVVSSANPELALSFNLPLHAYQAGSSSSYSSYSTRLLGYHVDMDGNIDFPVLGKLKVAGLTREQLSEMVKDRLIRNGMISDPSVNTDFMNFKISVLGEVRFPGTFTLTDDRINILEALSRAGDLTIYARRDNVLVRRETNGLVSYHRVDLRSTEIIRSPAFYLQQNDIVYVVPNDTIAQQTGINQNRSMGVLISLGSLLLSLAVIIFK